jgi:fatty-acyl-CoA synthase
VRAGTAEVGGTVEVVEYEPNCELAWTSVTGIEQRGRWRLRELEPGVTTVTLRIAYRAPGGVWGLIADRVSARQVQADVRRTLRTLRERCEQPQPSSESRRGARDPISIAAQQVQAVRVIASSGLLRPTRPDRLVGALLAVHHWGLSLPGGFAAAAVRYPDDVAIVDEDGTTTFAQLDADSNALANGLAASGIREGDRVGVLCRNHRGFVVTTLALTKLGADVLFLNTGFAAPQLHDVLRSESAVAVVHDEEFTELVGDSMPPRRRFVAESDVERLVAESDAAEPEPPERASRLVILTSGTTGKPKGASRGQPRTADPLLAILSRIPLRARETTLIAAPMFHAWGAVHLGLGVLLSSTMVLQRRFDPEQTLAAIEEHRVTALAAVPVMLQRILDLPASVRRRYDTSSLRVVAVSGSALSGDLARRFMDDFGDVLYNLYGSTEVAWATIATPEDLRAAPGTAGRPPYGTVVRLVDEHGRDVAPGATGRIFVGNQMLFEGYTGGGGKDVLDGLMATGDVGRFDEAGRLFVEGRDDEMIVSGGENVFPAEVEDVLGVHPDIADAAVIGVSDEEWGQRLAAYVVPRRGSRLSEDEVKKHVRSRLARYKVPRDVVIVKALPRNATGKVVKRELAELGQNGTARTRRSVSRAAPRTATRTSSRTGRTRSKR